jgi:quercetin dioxygenase-like cupin family protein
MKAPALLIAVLVMAGTTFARAPEPSTPSAQPPSTQPPSKPMPSKPTPPPSNQTPLTSTVFEWDKLAVEVRDNGVRRQVLDGPTATLDRLHAHITTLKPGERSGEPSLHKQEEVIIVREGTIEAQFDGQKRTAGPGSVIFFQSNAVTSLRNVGSGPATYTVVYYYTPLTPRP